MNTQKPSSFFIQTEHSSFLSFFCRSVSLAAFLSLLAIFAFTSFSSAQDSADGTKAADAMTIYQALNLKSAADLSLFSAAGTSISSTATVWGRILDQRTAGNSAAGQTDSDLRNAYALINELPCRQIAGTDLSDRTFKPGVYCLASTDLASRLTLDGQSDPKAIFVFRLADGLMVKNGARIDLANGAQAGNVFFLANGAAIIGDDVSFKGSLISTDKISVGANSEVDGRLLSLASHSSYPSSNVVIGAGSQVGPEQTGVLEICTSNDSTDSAGLVGRIFRFRVGSQIVPIVAGQCSGALTLPTGPVIITELQTGEDTGGAPFDGNFQLTDISELGTNPAGALETVNLPAFTAFVNIQAGSSDTKTRLRFTNRYTLTTIVEICKEALDTGVTGFFNFTINELRDGDGVRVPLTVPVGTCTGPIAIAAPSNFNNGQGTVTINELPRTGFIFTSVGTADGATQPINRLVNFNVLANGGGNATVTVAAGSSGGTKAKTTVFFNNRTAPGQLKICQIAGPGVPLNTPFEFKVTATAPSAPVRAATTVPGSSGAGTAEIGASLDTGVQTTQNLIVLAGPAAMGGNCRTIDGVVVDSYASITQLPSPNTAGGEVRVSRITSNSGVASPVVRAAGAPYFPLTGGVNTGAASNRTVSVPIIRETTEVEFVNFAFTAVPLKVCKIAGTGVAVGTAFTFAVTADTVGGLLAPYTKTFVLQAGPPATTPVGQNGFCDFVAGPFSPTIAGVTSFNADSSITVQEIGFGSTVIPAGGITSPSSSIIANTTFRTAVFPHLVNGINEVQFVNGYGSTHGHRKRIRFF